jgi:hypothetical protein
LKVRPHQYKRRCYACGSLTYTSEELYQEDFWKQVGPYKILKKDVDCLGYQGQISRGLLVISSLFAPLLTLSLLYSVVSLAVALMVFCGVASFFLLRTRSYIIDRKNQQVFLITRFHGLIYPKVRALPFTQIKEIIKSDDRDLGEGAPRFFIELILAQNETVTVYTSEDWGKNGRDRMFDLIILYIYGEKADSE